MATVVLDDIITLSFSVTDRKRTSDWYEKHLGFKQLFSADEAGWTELSTNTKGVTIGLADATEVNAGNSVPVFGVAAIEPSRAALEAEGIKFDGDTIHIEGMVKVATFYDPDGNALMLAQDLS